MSITTSVPAATSPAHFLRKNLAPNPASILAGALRAISNQVNNPGASQDSMCHRIVGVTDHGCIRVNYSCGRPDCSCCRPHFLHNCEKMATTILDNISVKQKANLRTVHVKVEAFSDIKVSSKSHPFALFLAQLHAFMDSNYKSYRFQVATSAVHASDKTKNDAGTHHMHVVIAYGAKTAHELVSDLKQIALSTATRIRHMATIDIPAKQSWSLDPRRAYNARPSITDVSRQLMYIYKGMDTSLIGPGCWKPYSFHGQAAPSRPRISGRIKDFSELSLIKEFYVMTPTGPVKMTREAIALSTDLEFAFGYNDTKAAVHKDEYDEHYLSERLVSAVNFFNNNHITQDLQQLEMLDALEAKTSA